MAVEKDDLDTNRLVTIGLVGALATAAISYLAAGMYHERVEQMHVERQQAPALQEARSMKAAQQPAGIEEAMREIADEK